MRQLKQRKCASRTCRELFTPIRRGLRLTKHCCAACELDDAQASGNHILSKSIERSPASISAGISSRVLSELQIDGNKRAEEHYAKINKQKLKKPRPKMRKLSAIKTELWDLFSLHQKLVHSSDGKWCNCYTCDKPIEIGTIDCQGGHAFSKAANPALWFDERAVRPQCSRCNCAEEGNHYIFNERLKQEIGMQDWQHMYDTRKTLRAGSRQVYLDKIEYYKTEVAKLKELKS